jgi:hypothetical protein
MLEYLRIVLPTKAGRAALVLFLSFVVFLTWAMLVHGVTRVELFVVDIVLMWALFIVTLHAVRPSRSTVDTSTKE